MSLAAKVIVSAAFALLYACWLVLSELDLWARKGWTFWRTVWWIAVAAGIVEFLLREVWGLTLRVGVAP